jgi:putative hemolysin
MINRSHMLAVAMIAFLLTAQGVIALKNPSAVYCTALGYEYTTEKTSEGYVGLCILPGNQSVSAWEFFRGEVAQEYSFCTKEGYVMKTVDSKEHCNVVYPSKCSVCVLENGTEVEASRLMGLSFLETECGDGICGIPENAETCEKDCPTGQYDYYCDGVADARCDPDCVQNEDPDCKGGVESAGTTAVPATQPTPMSWIVAVIALTVIALSVAFRKR